MLCSSFADMMENFNQGDLADIVRASGGAAAGAGLPFSDDWHQFQPDITVNDFQSSTIEDFGDPFSSNLRHPLFNDVFNDHDHLSTTTTSSTAAAAAASFFTATPGFLGSGLRPVSNNNNNIFSRMLQISPNQNLSVNSPCESQATAVGLLKVLAPPPASLLAASDVMKGGGGNLVDNGVGVQISSPRNAGIKRRKSQAKKVVCIPAPTPANSRPSGEVVPSDLWAWRKYGQKPIKGSPYPRGYYRCSSSKGCSARKQVERSRTDPNMLVITYTSEHNHPWPTQRNALAGSTRAQPNKVGSGSKSSNAGSQANKAKELEEEKERPNISENPLFDSSLVKEEMDEQMDMDGCGDVFGSDGFDLHSTYKPNLHESSHCDDLFADLGEIEGDSLSMLFSQGFDQERGSGGNKGNMLDHFNMFDWTENNSGNNNKNTASFQGGEGKGGS